MCKLNIFVLLICIGLPMFISAIQDDKLAEIFDRGYQVIEDIKKTELELTIFRAQMIYLGYNLSIELQEKAAKLRNGDATKEELQQSLANIKEIIEKVHLVEDTETGLIKIAKGRIFTTADEAETEISKILT
ncbi:hypothetical protein C0J52_12279 [Blattella germanica]|nr:hypothetical protein C0J52_12279 [Blattella germanica]